MSMKFAAMALAIGAFLATPAFAQASDPTVPATCQNGGSLASFKEAVAKSGQPIIVLEGKALTDFANAVDAIIKGEHDPAISALAFKNPDDAKEGENTINVVIFKNGCVTGVAPFPVSIIKQALGQVV